MGDKRISGKRQAQKELEKWEHEIIFNWKSAWYARLQSGRQLYRRPTEDSFAEWLDLTMEFLRNGKISNKRKNFWMKGLSMFSFLFTYAFVVYWNTQNAEVSVLTPVISLIPPCIISQWIKIKKYQETWSRYNRFYTLILLEMVKYIYKLNPYGSSQNPSSCFMEKMIILTEENEKCFYNIMVKKEDEMSFFSRITDRIK